ncbi:hypothetical protein EJB05_24807, partial [Eragrostis curvula]
MAVTPRHPHRTTSLVLLAVTLLLAATHGCYCRHIPATCPPIPASSFPPPPPVNPPSPRSLYAHRSHNALCRLASTPKRAAAADAPKSSIVAAAHEQTMASSLFRKLGEDNRSWARDISGKQWLLLLHEVLIFHHIVVSVNVLVHHGQGPGHNLSRSRPTHRQPPHLKAATTPTVRLRHRQSPLLPLLLREVLISHHIVAFLDVLFHRSHGRGHDSTIRHRPAPLKAAPHTARLNVIPPSSS